MRQLSFLLLLIGFPLLFIGQASDIKRPNSIAFTHVTVLNMTGGPAKRDMTVIVSGNRISVVEKSQNTKVPKGTKVIDATGKFMLPGLWDMHVHALRQQGLNTDNFFSLFIANGITGVREMGNSPLSMSEVQHLRKEIETGKRLGPRFFACGPLVDGGFSGWKSTVVVTTEQQGRAVVDSLKKAGADFIKVYFGLSPKVYFAIADEANKQGISFAGHIPEGVSAKEASNAGQKSVEHFGDDEFFLACSSIELQLRQERLNLSRLQWGTPEFQEKLRAHNQLLLDSYSEAKAKELFSWYIKNNTWQCPTLIARYAGSHFIEPSQSNQDRLKYLSGSVKGFWSENTESRKKYNNPATMELLKKRYKKELQSVAAMSKAGVPILAGSDDLNPYVFPGFSLHEELGLLVEAGLSPLQALQTATLNPAKYFGLTDFLGTVEKGKWADLLLLDANPLTNISNTRKIAAVVANGRYFPKKALEQTLKEAETAASQK
jgi:hypothetical protein